MTLEEGDFEKDPSVVIFSYVEKNNINYNTLAQVLIGAIHVEFAVFKILEVSTRFITPANAGFGRNVETLLRFGIIDQEQRDAIVYIKNTRNRFAHEINACLGEPMAEFSAAVMKTLIFLCHAYIHERDKAPEGPATL